MNLIINLALLQIGAPLPIGKSTVEVIFLFLENCNFESLRRWEKDLFLWKLSLVLQLTSVISQLFQKVVEAYMLPEGIMGLRENKLFLKEGYF